MAQVATCPQYNHELLVPEAIDPAAWAKCPECRAFFQVSEARARELPALLLADAAGAETAIADATEEATPTLDDLSSMATWSGAENDSSETVVASAADAETVLAEPAAASLHEHDELQAAAQRIDEWFRSSKTVPDAPPLATDEVAAAPPVDLASDDELELEAAPEPSVRTGTWDDAQHMERLFADIQPPRATPPTTAPPPEEASATETTSAPISETAKQAELPKFVSHTNGKRPRKRSLVRTVLLSAVAGVVGLAAGYYVLLWLRGESGDFLDLAQYLPPAVLPGEFDKTRSAPVAPSSSEFAAAVERAQADAASADDAGERAEMQATFTAPEEGLSRDLPGDDEPDGIADTETAPPFAEPAPLDVLAAEPLAGEPLANDAAPDDDFRPVDAPTFTANELSASLQAATEAQPSLVQGDLKDGREVQRAKGYGYSMLADLAQKASFVTASETPAESLLDEADALFRQSLADAHTRTEVAHILPRWLTSPHRKHGGVFFAATLDAPQPGGATVEYQARLDSGQSLAVLLPKPLAERAEPSRPVAIVGWILERPAEQLPGYTGESEQAVWAARLIPLE